MGVLPNILKDMRDPYLDATVYFCLMGNLPKKKRHERPISSSFFLFFLWGSSPFFKDMRGPYLNATVYFALWETFPKRKDMSDPYLVAFSIFCGGPPHF